MKDWDAFLTGGFVGIVFSFFLWLAFTFPGKDVLAKYGHAGQPCYPNKTCAEKLKCVETGNILEIENEVICILEKNSEKRD